MEFGGNSIMINLPFKMKFIFDFSTMEEFHSEIFNSITSEISQIKPEPNVQIYISNTGFIKSIENSFKDLEYEINIIFSDNLKIDTDSSEKLVFICKSDKTAEGFHFLKQNASLNFKKIIIEHSEYLWEKEKYQKFLQDIKEIREYNLSTKVFLKPYLTEKETENYYSNKTQNREFLTCAAAWLTPIFDEKGNLYCCKDNKIGNISKTSFWVLWNSENANNIRKKIIERKHFCHCNNCNLFYEDTFLIVQNSILKYKNNIFYFDSELNYTKSSHKIIISGEEKSNNNYYNITVEPFIQDKKPEASLSKKNLLILE